MQNDIQLQQAVLAALYREANITPDVVGAEVHHGVVKLCGRVNEPATRRMAELTAKRVPGVRTVVLDIDVTDKEAVPQRTRPKNRVAEIV
jgi:osmotically-inducible protein OsmY